MKEIILNLNNTYTIKMDGYSITANATELELVFNKCFNKSILYLFKQLENE